MNKFLLATLSCLIAATLNAADSQWTTSLPQAKGIAARDGKLILLDFTGSDWCGWCKKLHQETFEQQAFLDFAAKNLVLVEVDFPHNKAQSDELKAANDALKNKYNVHGFPTLVLMKSDETVLWKQPGYLPGGPAAMISQVSHYMANPVAATAPAAAAPTQAPAGSVRMPIYDPPPQHLPGDAPKLSGILYSSRHASAVVNGRTCEEGDIIEGARIVKIARDKVTVEWKGQVLQLRIN